MTAEPEVAPPRRPTAFRRVVAVVASVLVVAFLAATARFFVWPPRGAPAHADAVVLFNGDGPRLDTALRLAGAHVAPNLVVSRGSQYWGQGSRCAPVIPGVTVTCFVPTPKTTQGEAEFAGRLAATHHWTSIVLVTGRAQDTRARLRTQRCFGGDVHVVTVGHSITRWPFAITYEWAATIKALVLQTTC